MKLCMELYRLHYVSRVFGVRTVFAKDMKKAVTNFVTAWFSVWAIQGLNLGPPDYESVALTNWAKSPTPTVFTVIASAKVLKFGQTAKFFVENVY